MFEYMWTWMKKFKISLIAKNSKLNIFLNQYDKVSTLYKMEYMENK